MPTRWIDIVDRNKDVDENISAIRGYYLNCLGVDLEKIPHSLMEPCVLYETEGKKFTKARIQRVYVDWIAGTSYTEYAGGTWLDTVLRLHRADYYIRNDYPVRGKFFKLLKQDYYDHPAIRLTRDKTGKLYVDGNGNHRVTFYKMMRLTDELMEGAVIKQQFHMEQRRNPSKLYWLYATVKDEI